MNLHCFGSSSKGNSYLLEADGRLLLIDAGLSCKRIVDGITAAGHEVESLAGVFITHEHEDHVSALPQLMKRFPTLGIYANHQTIDTICTELSLSDGDFWGLENGQEVELGGFTVVAFPTFHDASDSVGYFVRAGDAAYFHATDVGCLTEEAGRYFAEADIATLESNHDPVLLNTSGRPQSIIRRIERNHLSNARAAEFVKRYGPSAARLRRLDLAHLSHACNTPAFARDCMLETLRDIRRLDIDLEVLE